MRWVTCVVGCALLCSGCSAITVETLPANYGDLPAFRCTSNKIAPGFDLLWGIGGVVSLAALGVIVEQGDVEIETAPAVGIFASAVASIAYLASAEYGFRKTSECGHALDTLYAKQAEKQASAVTLAETPATVIKEGVAVVYDAARTREWLVATLQDASGYRVTIVGEPKREAAEIWIQLRREGFSTDFAKCESLTLATNQHVNVLTVHSYYIEGQGAAVSKWQAKRGPVKRAQLDRITTAWSAGVRACSDDARFTSNHRAIIGTFLKRWDAMAPLAPKVDAIEAQPSTGQDEGASVAPDGGLPLPVDAPPVPAPEAATPAATGCQYDTQCKGDRICKAGQCIDAPQTTTEPGK